MLLLMCLTFGLEASSAESDSKWSLELWYIDNDVPMGTFSFSDFEPKITFSEDELIVTTKYLDVFFYDLSEIRKITYKKENGTGVRDVIADNAKVKFIGDVIIFASLNEGDNISVFATNGVQVLNKYVSSNGALTLPLSDLNQGLYVIRVNNKSFKVVKK